LVNRNAVIEFILDLSKWRPGARQVNRDLRNMRQGSDQAAAGQQRLAGAVQQSGDAAAASAVRFQTMTQGMLNLTTAGVQTFTSMSNIDRAGNRLAQSNIAVARATDLLNNKELRLQQIRESGGDPRKIVLVTKEIATARADLTVKTDKLKIEEGALRDVQLLFATNIANVTISSMQTITTLKQAQVFATLKQIFVQKILNRVMQQTIVTTATGAPVFRAFTASTTLGTFAIRGMTVSIKGLLITLGPIALVIGGIAAVMHIWENDIGGVKTALQEWFPFLKDQTKLLDDTKDIIGDTTQSYEELTAGIQGLSKDSKGPMNIWALETARHLGFVRSEAIKTQAVIAGLAAETEALEAVTANFRLPIASSLAQSQRDLRLHNLSLEDKKQLTGATGDTGLQGLTGVSGDVGKQGVKGIQGLQGFEGDMGIPGLVGKSGGQGEQGIQGLTGNTGIQGLIGLEGERGQVGIHGHKGLTGDKGDIGKVGPRGFIGTSGSSIKGPKGDRGFTGKKGSDGKSIKGDKGEPGHVSKDDEKIDFKKIKFPPGTLNFIRSVRTLAPLFIDADKLAFIRDELNPEKLIDQKFQPPKNIDPKISGITATTIKLPKPEPTFAQSFEKAFTESRLPFDTVKKVIGINRGLISQDKFGVVREVKVGSFIFGEPFQRQQTGLVPLEKREPLRRIIAQGGFTPQTESFLVEKLKDLNDQKGELQVFLSQGTITQIEFDQATNNIDLQILDTKFVIQNLIPKFKPAPLPFEAGLFATKLPKVKPAAKFFEFDRRLTEAREEQRFLLGLRQGLAQQGVEVFDPQNKLIDDILFEKRLTEAEQTARSKLKTNPATGKIHLADVQNRKGAAALAIIAGGTIGPKTFDSAQQAIQFARNQKVLSAFNNFPQRTGQVGFQRSAALQPTFGFTSPFNISQSSVDFAGRPQFIPPGLTLSQQNTFIQSQLIQGIGGQSFAVAQALISQGGLTIQGQGLLAGGANFSTIANFIGSGLVSATAAAQRPVGTPLWIVQHAARQDSIANLFRAAFGFQGMGRRGMKLRPSIGANIQSSFTLNPETLPPDLVAAAMAQLAEAKNKWNAFQAVGFGNYGGRWREATIRRMQNMAAAGGVIKMAFQAIVTKRVTSAFNKYSPFLDITERDVRIRVMAGRGNTDVFGDQIRWNERLDQITSGEV